MIVYHGGLHAPTLPDCQKCNLLVSPSLPIAPFTYAIVATVSPERYTTPPKRDPVAPAVCLATHHPSPSTTPRHPSTTTPGNTNPYRHTSPPLPTKVAGLTTRPTPAVPAGDLPPVASAARQRLAMVAAEARYPACRASPGRERADVLLALVARPSAPRASTGQTATCTRLEDLCPTAAPALTRLLRDPCLPKRTAKDPRSVTAGMLE